MTALILPRRFTQQPQGRVEVDAKWTAGLRGIFSPLHPVLAYGANSTTKAYARGIGFTTIGNSLGVQVSASRIVAGLNNSTVFVAYSREGMTSGTAGRQLYCERSDDLQIFKIGLKSASTSLITFVFRNSTGQLINEATTATIDTNRLVNTAAFVTDGAASRTIYADGNGSTNTTNFANSFTTANNCRIGGDGWGTGEPFNGGIYYVALWGRSLTQSEISSLSSDPWQIFRPHREVLYFDVGGGTGDTPSAADAGALTLTGSAADGIRALLSAADAGTLTLTGSAADGILARLGVADSGSLTLTGSAADALRALAGVAGSGSITLTGSDAAGVYTPVGDTPSAADSGSLTLTGSAAVGTYDRLAAADSGSLTLTGADAAGQIQAPGAYTSDADAGSLALLGYDANGVFAGAVTLTQADLDAIAAAVWADPVAVSAHAKLDAILARITC